MYKLQNFTKVLRSPLLMLSVICCLVVQLNGQGSICANPPQFITAPTNFVTNVCDSWENNVAAWLQSGANSVINLNGRTLTCITSDYYDTGVVGWVYTGCSMNQYRDVVFTAKFMSPVGVVSMANFCSRVTLVDNRAPEWDMLPMDKTITCSASTNVATEIQAWLQNRGGAWVGSCSGTITVTNNYNPTTASVCNSATTVIFTATDNCGRSNTATAKVTVNDSTPPALIGLPAFVTINGCNSPVPPSPNVTATDACGSATVTMQEIVDNISSRLSGSQEVPARATVATGSITSSMNATGLLTISGSYSGLTTPLTAAHLHTGAFGTNGGVTVDLVPAAITIGSTSGSISGSVQLNATQIASLIAGNIYINLHTSTFPSGEIRGQLGGCFRVTRTWTATDACSNSLSESRAITVLSAAPTFTAVPANQTIQCPAVPSFGTPTLNANCGAYAFTFTDVTTGGSCPASGSIRRTWIATDMCGNSNTATSTITFAAPAVVSISCPANVTVTATSSNGAVVTYGTPTASTTCLTAGSINIVRSSGPASGSVFPVGTTQVCFTATDACGATASCCMSITVNAPVTPSVVTINCPANISITATTGATSAIATFNAATASSTCATGGVTVTQISGPASGANFPVGATQVCYRATDACGASASCCFTVTIVGSTVNPGGSTASINCPANVNMTAPAGATGMVVNYSTPTGNTLCTQTGTLNIVRISGPASGSIFPIGTTQVCFQATDACGGTASCCFNVTVTGSTPGGSTITINIPPNVTISCGQISNLPLATTSTTCPTGSVTVTNVDAVTGTSCTGLLLTRTYTATDACGNVATKTYTITQLPDTTPPVWASLPPLDQMINCGTPINIGTATATDCSSPVTITSVVTNNGANACNTVNGITYGYDVYVAWTARDLCGNTATANTNIWVLPVTNIGFLNKPADKQLACSDGLAFDQPMPKSFVADIVDMTFYDDTDIDVCGAGTITRNWIATDAKGNTCQAQQTMTILPDVQKPEITLPYHYTKLTCVGALPTFTPTVQDNCTAKTDLVVTTLDKQLGNIIERTYVVSDACGNLNAAILTIEMTDDLAPVFSAQPAAKTINCGEALVFDAPVAQDDCLLASTIIEDKVQQNACSTIHTRIWTATDAVGNTAKMEQQITVADVTAPVILTNFAQQTEITTAQFATWAPATIDATDNCNTIQVSHAITQLDNCNFSVRYTVVDACGNAATTNQLVHINDGACSVLSAVNIGASRYEVYPNPVSDRLVLKLADGAEYSALVCDVFDMHGRRVVSVNMTGTQSELDVTSLQSGTYYLRLTNGKESASAKFVKI
jgi:large repetitive protein